MEKSKDALELLLEAKNQLLSIKPQEVKNLPQEEKKEVNELFKQILTETARLEQAIEKRNE